jgi:hypothetical protein
VSIGLNSSWILRVDKYLSENSSEIGQNNPFVNFFHFVKGYEWGGMLNKHVP